MTSTVQRKRHISRRGVTLIEMLMVILIIGIVASMAGSLLSSPMLSYVTLSRRTTLVQIGQTIQGRMARDIRMAAPNTLRITNSGSIWAIEFINTVEGGRYRRCPETGICVDKASPDNPLTPENGDATFDTIGLLTTYNSILSGANCTNNNSALLVVVGNQGTPGCNAYAGTASTPTNIAQISKFCRCGAGVAGCTDTDFYGNQIDRITVTNANLPAASAFPSTCLVADNRFYLVDTPVSYLCDTNTNTITRYAGYNLVLSQPVNTAVAPLNAVTSSGLIGNQVTTCSFTYNSSENLVGISITVSDTGSGENVTLFNQFHISNVP